jgi:hypothetical protein
VTSARDAFGNPTALSGVTWTSSNTTVADVSSSGVITGKALGASTVTAHLGSASMALQAWVVPATINSCETNTAQLCTNWVLSDSVYSATWSQGSHAIISVGQFSADSARFVRLDPDGTSAGMRALYRGNVVNRAVPGGGVVWNDGVNVFSGSWSATW